MMEPVRILHVFHSMNCGGAENMIMNLYRQIDKKKLQFDFLVHTQKKGYFDEEIKNLGGNIYYAPYYNIINYSQYKSALEDLFMNHPEIRVVHGHLGSCSHIYLSIAKKYGCFTIAHSHSTRPSNISVKNVIYRLFTYKTRSIADYFIGCSKSSGEYRYGKEITNSNRFCTLNNAIDCELYKYRKESREIIRSDLGVGDSFLIGHVGRFTYAKNHTFLLDIFCSVLLYIPNSKLLLVGDGELHNQVVEKVNKLHLNDRVIFTGLRNDIPNLLHAMDCFVFPSNYEGLPVSVIEAQAAALRCFISDTITPEVIISDLVEVLSLNDDPNKWAESITQKGRNYLRKDMTRAIIEAGYDIRTTTDMLTNLYLSHLK